MQAISIAKSADASGYEYMKISALFIDQSTSVSVVVDWWREEVIIYRFPFHNSINCLSVNKFAS
jgi:hypothetical protein